MQERFVRKASDNYRKTDESVKLALDSKKKKDNK